MIEESSRMYTEMGMLINSINRSMGIKGMIIIKMKYNYRKINYNKYNSIFYKTNFINNSYAYPVVPKTVYLCLIIQVKFVIIKFGNMITIYTIIMTLIMTKIMTLIMTHDIIMTYHLLMTYDILMIDDTIMTIV